MRRFANNNEAVSNPSIGFKVKADAEFKPEEY